VLEILGSQPRQSNDRRRAAEVAPAPTAAVSTVQEVSVAAPVAALAVDFADLGLSEPLLKAVAAKGYRHPSPIQSQCIPAVLEGRDVMAAAQTGTGKTAGFTLPLLERLLHGAHARSGVVRALVLTPTRELAAQVADSVTAYGRYLDLRSAVVFGGVSPNPQIERLRRGVDVLVATPGRLMDLHQQGALRLDRVEILVLDEADRMLDMGFIRDIRRILSLLPQKRQNLLFSATFSAEIRRLATGLLHQPGAATGQPRKPDRRLGAAGAAPLRHGPQGRPAQPPDPQQRLAASAGVLPHQARCEPAGGAALPRRPGSGGDPRQQEPGGAHPGSVGLQEW
jgi:hypothetical protein